MDVGKKTENSTLRNIKRLIFISEVETVYSAVHAGSLYNTDTFRP